MTARAKIAVSLPADLVEAARRAVRHGRAASVSAYVEAALNAYIDSNNYAWLDQMLEESGGPLTKGERDWADRVLGW